MLTPDQRFRSMQHNRGRTKPEKLLASALWHAGLRFYTVRGYRNIFGSSLPGSPDIIFPRRRVAVFIDGCFWHGCTKCRRVPNPSSDFWVTKITRNKERDRRVGIELRRLGWNVVRVWEHELKSNDLRGGVNGVVESVALAIARRA
ncbi:MAG: very short patch repair endonuclease [Candidatus Binataceae bacterium]